MKNDTDYVLPELPEAPFSDKMLSKLNEKETERFNAAVEELTKVFPVKTLFKGPMGVDATLEIKVSRWPRKQADLDAAIAILQAIRAAFPE